MFIEKSSLDFQCVHNILAVTDDDPFAAAATFHARLLPLSCIAFPREQSYFIRRYTIVMPHVDGLISLQAVSSVH